MNFENGQAVRHKWSILKTFYISFFETTEPYPDLLKVIYAFFKFFVLINMNIFPNNFLINQCEI